MNSTADHSAILAPIVQRIEQPTDEVGRAPTTRVSLMEFSAPPASMQAPAPAPARDHSLILGVVGGLIGAGLIIALTLYLFN